MCGGPLPLRLRAWDGSSAGPADAPAVVLRSRRALRRLLWQPDELGLAQAYVTGELDIEGDLADALRAVRRGLAATGAARPGAADLARALGTALRLGALGPRPRAPRSQAALRGSVHSRARDRAAISHHYDLSNEFYALLLDGTMAYSCGYWTDDRPGYGLAEAQQDKLELACRTLGLGPGAHLLDIGCGWGSLTLHAAEHHGAHVTAVTLAARQAAYVRAQVAERGLGDRVEVRLSDYRDITDGPYDAVATIEMGEHVGDDAYPDFAGLLHDRVRPGGRVLVQQMSRGRNAPGGGAFIESFIAPDMHMRPLGETVTLLEGAGLEVTGVEALRTHYVRTIEAWHRTLEERWPEFTAMAGVETARVWRLYLVGSALAFEQNRMGVDQIVARRPDGFRSTGMS
ncbi:cyclopropane-fatty-acyl-phospholipid synthase family protein [Streptomyces sp. NBC_01497]|uniref:cyclopropane-fatty-acyl-phospholipid synthase family protein n=1 Tax=Streptomyces sp. NBC_01497 TaxID=2903885 RepID=UPI002E32314C|nr:cyclopropane-fatty-acyl-phospholipid synthase family protein [Streptomyces sp. NBC_01497]